MRSRRSCKLCGRTARFVGSTLNRASATRVLDHFRCLSCGSVFVGTDLSSRELAEAYEGLNWGLYYSENGGQTARKLAASADDLERIFPRKDCRVIDIGTGNGAFLRCLWERGFRNLGAHDLPGAQLTALDGLPCARYHDTDWSSLPSDGFDVATLLDVVEHVPDPHALLSASFRCLAPGGLVYFHTPVVTPMDRLMHALQGVPVLDRVRRMWQAGRTSIYHLQNYTSRSLLGLLGQAGFVAVRIAIRNELSWPLRSYVRTYLTRPLRLPDAASPLLAPLVWPFLTVLNPNKAIVTARKPGVRREARG